jgi:N-methylhydantoinase A
MQAVTPGIRAGVDIGGTFTDVALEYGDQIFTSKVLTDYEKPERAIVEALKAAAALANVQLCDLDAVIHGTTLATNALIEKRGARTAFITSEGFRDVIEMRNEGRFEQYDLSIQLPPALVPRCDRFTVAGRLDAQGNELLALDLAGLNLVVEQLRAGNYQSIAVGLMHSYRNAVHERQVRDVLAAAMPAASISLSSDVSPQIREFERFNTVCANAYVKPLMASYLNRLAQALADEGTTCPLYMIHSGGGLMSLKSAAEYPVRLLESGPAGGAIYASHIAKRYGLNKVISYDMGGTTAKICLIENQQPKTSRTFEVARTYRFKKGSGMPISIPVIEMVEIGAGGGSIAHVDNMRQVRVGPESAGSEPGPACYGRNGEHPTVTDADLLLNKLDANRFAGGAFKLDGAASQRAMENHIAKTLGSDAVQSAFAVAEMVDENMANAARMHAVESGCELEQYTMIAYGGAAPLHAARLCEKLGIDRLVVPPGAGVGSAIGFLRAPFGYESLRSAVMRLSQFDSAMVNQLVADMRTEVSAFLDETAYQGKVIPELKAYMRYAGQGWEIPVASSIFAFDASAVAGLRQNFIDEYVHLFGHEVEGLDIEVVSWSLSLRSEQVAPDLATFDEGVSTTANAAKSSNGVATAESDAVTPIEVKQVFDAKSAKFLTCRLFDRQSLPRKQKLDGPIVVVEKETSTYVSAGYSLVLQDDDSLLIVRREKGAH